MSAPTAITTGVAAVVLDVLTQNGVCLVCGSGVLNGQHLRDDPCAFVALAAQADCGGINCGKCQQCLTVHEFFLKEACEQHKAELATLHESRARDIQLHTEHLTRVIWDIKDAAVTHGVNDKVGEAIAHAVMVTRNNT